MKAHFFAHRQRSRYAALIGAILLFAGMTSAERAFAAGASLFLAPASGTFFVGNTFSVSILLTTGDDTAGSVDIELAFPPDKLQITSPNTGISFIDSWVEPPSYSNVEGTLRLSGGTAGGFQGSSALVSTAVFRVVGIGQALVQFSSNSKVLAADGSRKNMLSPESLGGGRYLLDVPLPEGPKASSPTHQDPAVWYRNASPSVRWERGGDTSDFSYVLDQNPFGSFDVKSRGTPAAAVFMDIADGIWYFHLRAKRGEAWGGETIFPFRIDTTPPAPFTPRLVSAGSLFKRRYVVIFETKDGASGIDHYEIQMTDVQDPRNAAVLFTAASSPYALPDFKPSIYRITVRAFDRAGNTTDGAITLNLLQTFSVSRQGFRIRNTVAVSWATLLIFGTLMGALSGFAVHEFTKHGSVRKRVASDIEAVRAVVDRDIREFEKHKGEERHLEELLQEAEKLKKLGEDLERPMPPPPAP